MDWPTHEFATIPGVTDQPQVIDHDASPLVDREGDHFMLTESASPVIFLSHARRRALVTAAANAKRHVLVTGERTALTHAYAELASMLGGTWVVASQHGYRDALTGRRLRAPEDVVIPSGAPEQAPEYARPPIDETTIVSVSASIRQRNRSTADYGSAVRLLAELLVDDVTLRWGAQEPVMAEWDDATVASHVRANLERTPWLIVAGEGPTGRRVTGTLRVRPTKQGSEEIISLVVDAGPRDSEEAALTLADLPSVLGEFDGEGMPLIAAAYATIGRSDLLNSSTLEFPSVPMALLIGAPGVAKFELDLELLTDEFDAFVTGPSRRESVVFALGANARPDNLVELRDVVVALGAEALAEEFGDEFVASLIGQDWRAQIAEELAEIDAEGVAEVDAVAGDAEIGAQALPDSPDPSNEEE